MPEFGELRRVDLRELWPHEAADFTPWLAENLSALGSAIGLDLELTERESGVGLFSCDLVARELGSDRIVVIENQLESANHQHLGQLLTYAGGKEASIVVWVARDIRDEYRQALLWLNSRTDSKTDFFGIVVEAVRIDDSRPAFNFKVVASPNEWQKKAAEISRGAVSSKNEQYRDFFQSLIDELRETYSFTNSRNSQPQNWITFSTGVTGLRYGINFPQGNRVRVDLYIDFGDRDLNKAFFNAMFRDKVSVENALGEPLNWERLENARASRIALYREGSIDTSAGELSVIHTWGIEQLLKFKKVLGPLLDSKRKEAIQMVSGTE